MQNRFRIRAIDILVILLIVGFAGYRRMVTSVPPTAPATTFVREVNLEPLYQTAVHADGRLRSFASHAKTYMGFISGPHRIHNQPNGFTYLDIMFRPERYVDTDMIYIKNKLVLNQILDVLHEHPPVDPIRTERIQKSRLISPSLLSQPSVSGLLQRLGQDLIRTAKSVDAIQSALTVSDPRFLMDNLRFIPPPNGDIHKPWISPAFLSSAAGTPMDSVHAGMLLSPHIPGLDSSVQQKMAQNWFTLQTVWQQEDAAAVNAQIAKLAQWFPSIAPSIYPSVGRLKWESWYFRSNSMTWVWLIYLACVVPLLMSAIYKWEGARKVGMIAYVIAFGFHTATLVIRWYISGRWPNSNMFEALTTSAWFGGVAALVLEWFARRTPFRNLFVLGSAVMSMAALMAAYFLPAQLNSAISNKMAALNDVWLYIHTNMIIWSYAIIGLACVPALLQLRHRWCVLWDQKRLTRIRLIMLPIALGVLNYTGYLLFMHLIDNAHRGLSARSLIGVAGSFWGSLMIIILEAFNARARREAGIAVERSASGGASALMMGSQGGYSFLKPDKPSTTQIFDGATMVLVELAFIMLWTGVTMGAIWADHSWGRPWGWDPKEVFALNTFIIFLILIHVRLKVRDKGFWTAVLAVVGFEVMMFNWIVVNFVITGLHSYA